MSQGNVLYQKHDFLLHPIKDLTKNWNVDIASILTDYMSDVSKMVFTFNDGQTNLNFAEASMLIQGSTCVWSRKVEYLNSLVYQTLEIITKNKQDKQKSNDENPESENTSQFEDNEDQFLDLDDLNLCAKKNMASENTDEEVELLTKIATQLFSVSNDRGSLFYSDLGEMVNYYSDFWSNHVSSLPANLQLGPGPSINKDLAVEEENGQVSSNDDVICDDIIDDGDEGGSCHADDYDDAAVEAFNEIVEEVVEEKQVKQRRISSGPELMSVLERSRIPVVLLEDNSLCDVWTPMKAHIGKTIKIPKSLQSNPRKRKRKAADSSVAFITDFFKKMKVKSHSFYDYTKDVENRRLDQLWKVLKITHTRNKRSAVHQRENQYNIDNGDDQYCDDDNNDCDLPDISNFVNEIDVDKEQISIINNIINSTGLSYEEQVLECVQRFFKHANQQRKESKLSQRVKEWESAITPFMELESQRPEFDIHKYGDDVLNEFNKVGEKKDFQDVSCKKENWVICRRLAATLQLANDGNFLLQSKGDTTQSCVNTLSLKLLSSQHLRDRLDDYNHA